MRVHCQNMNDIIQFRGVLDPAYQYIAYYHNGHAHFLNTYWTQHDNYITGYIDQLSIQLNSTQLSEE